MAFLPNSELPTASGSYSYNGRLSMPSGGMGQKGVATVTLTDIKTGEKLTLSWTPEKIDVKTSGRFQSYNIIETGDVRLPRGENLEEISWAAVLPGKTRKADAFVRSEDWKEPQEIVATLERWRKNGRKVKLLITQTDINNDVYIKDLSLNYAGGLGDISYNISFIQAKDLIVRTIEELDGKKEEQLEKRPEKPKQETHTVVEGDTLWDIAEEKLGDATRWPEIYELNKDQIDDPDLIYPGQEFKLP